MKDKKFMILCISIVAVFILGISIFLFVRREHANIYYRTYTKENGWSRWVKNGKVSGDGQHTILNIEIKVKSNNKGDVDYAVYQNGNWTQTAGNIEGGKFKDKPIYGIRVGLVGTLGKKYMVYYRTYNSKDKWLEWTYSAGSSGNAKTPIKKIQMKVLLDNTSLEDYLEDYYNNGDASKGLKEAGEK